MEIQSYFDAISLSRNHLPQNLRALSLEREVLDDDTDYSEQYTMMASKHELLEFNSRESIALCIGIDKQLDRRFLNSLGSTVANDAEETGRALITSFGLNEFQVKVCISSTQPEQCSKRGIENVFMETAKRVGTQGLFMFYFAGHGYLVREKCVLVPSDFTGAGYSCVSCNDLMRWLQVSHCKARYVVFIFDCCHAGDLGTNITDPHNILKIPEAPGIIAMCACSAREESTALKALDHSIFSHFLLSYLKRHKCEGIFAIAQAMKEIKELSIAFSSLIVTYDSKLHGLFINKMHPTLEALDLHMVDICASIDETDSSRLEPLFKLYDQKRKSRPHIEVDRWLNSSDVRKCLHTLASKASFTKTLQQGVLCAMLHSVASIQLKYDRTLLTERNLFITMTINVLAAIGYAYHGIEISDIHQLIDGLKHYCKPLLRAGVDICLLNMLLSELKDMPSTVFSSSTLYSSDGEH